MPTARDTRRRGTQQRVLLSVAALAVAVLAVAAAGAIRLVSHQPRRGRVLASLTLCAARPTASLRAELTGPVPSALRGSVQPLGVSGDGRAAYVASTRTGAYVAVTQADGGALEPGPSLMIQDFLGPPTLQAPQYQPSVIRVISIGDPAWPACHGT